MALFLSARVIFEVKKCVRAKRMEILHSEGIFETQGTFPNCIKQEKNRFCCLQIKNTIPDINALPTSSLIFPSRK